MKILLVNQTFYPDVAATAQCLTDFSLQLVSQGHDVTVLASRRGYTEKDGYHAKYENYKGVNIRRVRPIIYGQTNKAGRMIEAACLNLAFAWKMFWFSRFDTVVALTSPPLVAFFAAALAKARDSKFVYWVMDLNPDEAVAAGWIRENSLSERLLRFFLRWTLNQSDSVVALDDFMAERIIRKGIDKDKIFVVPPWSHGENLKPVHREDNSFLKKHKLEESFVVMYSGNHSICHPLDTLLETARLLSEDEAIVFLFVGGGARVRDVADFKEKHHLKNIRQLPYVRREDLNESLSSADLHAVVMGNEYVGIVHPCKIYAVLKLKKPYIFIGPQKSHIGGMIKGKKGGFHFNHGESSELAEFIRTLAGKTRENLPETAFPKKFSKKILIQKMTDVIVRKSSDAA